MLSFRYKIICYHSKKSCETSQDSLFEKCNKRADWYLVLKSPSNNNDINVVDIIKS